MRTTAILNLKGGVGKTTTVINMAAVLAQGGARVLVVDGDCQCNTTNFLSDALPEGGTFSDLLRHGPSAAPERVSTSIEGVTLLPADETLMDLDLTKAEEGKVFLHCLKRGWHLPAKNTFDFCLIDCPPAFSASTAAALIAADDVIIPIKLDAFSISGMANLFRQIENMRKINPELKISGILPTMYYRSPQASDALAQIRKAGLPMFRPIRRSGTVDRMTYAGTPLTICSPKSGALHDYRAMVDEYFQQWED